MSNKSVPKLQTTANHDLFVQSEFNRDLRGLDALRKSMKKHGFIAAYPLHCIRGAGGKLVIKAGHHRYAVAKELGIPVFYVVSEDRATIPETEMASHAWTLNDYVKSYARAGSEAHLAITAYAERTGIKFSQAASLLGGECANSSNMTDRVKSGTFQLKEGGHAEKVAEVVIGLREIGVSFATNASLVGAISCVCWLPEFDTKKFLHRSAVNLHLFVKQSTKTQFLDLIERVYNFQAKDRIALAFLAKESAKSRSAVNKKKIA